MKVFFGCDAQEILKYKDAYVIIRDTIKNLGHTITRDWIDLSIKRAEENVGDPGSKYYAQTIESLLAADVIVIEGTIQSTSLGHQITLALQKNKPVLYLTQKKKDQLIEEFISGTGSKLLTIKSYTLNNVDKIVEDYLNQNDGEIKTSFNLVRDKIKDNFLEWAAYTYKKSKPELIKEAIDEKVAA